MNRNKNTKIKYIKLSESFKFLKVWLAIEYKKTDMFYPVSLILKSLPIYNRLEMFRALLDKKFAIRV